MKRSCFAVVAGLGLWGFAPAARAQDTPPPAGGTMDTGNKGETTQSDEPKKHLAEVDVYLRDALDNVKVIYNTTQLQPGKLDKTIIRESVGNIDKSLTGAITHLGHIKSLPEARVSDMAKVDALQTALNQAKQTSSLLKTATRVSTMDTAHVSQLATRLFGQLRAADDDFGAIADQQNLTRVDKLTVPERQPVRGMGQPGTNVPPDVNQPMQNPPMPSHPATPAAPQRGKPMENPPSGNY
jgi:hypothetical protein